MALDILNGKIRVYNYDLSPVGFPSQHNQSGVFLRGRDEEEEFVVERVAFDDIEAENSKSDLFRVGRIRFHSDEEDEIYAKLGIEDRENILTDKELIKLLSDDAIKTVKKISNIRSVTLITRMKSMLFTMERANKTPPHRINATVLEREHELLSGGKRNPDSEINKILESEKRATQEHKIQETLEALIKKVDVLEKEKEDQNKQSKAKDDIITQSQTAIEQLLKKVEELTKDKDDQSDTKKQVGRPPKKG